MMIVCHLSTVHASRMKHVSRSHFWFGQRLTLRGGASFYMAPPLANYRQID
jgi:hypothetical protein